MKYNKPNMTVLVAAIAAIQAGECNKGKTSLDSHGCSNNHVTIGAYEADE